MAYFAPITAAMDWRTDRRVARVLETCAQVSPPTRRLASHEQWDRVEDVYTGYRVDVLSAIREQIIGEQLREAEAIGDVPLMKAVCAQISVQDAIAEVVRIQPVHVITTAVRKLDPAIWGALA